MLIKNYLLKFSFVAIIFIINIDNSYGLSEFDDLHSSVTALFQVLSAEKDLIGSMASYISESEERINSVKRFANKLKDVHEQGVRSTKINNSLNPIQSVLLTKRLSTEVSEFLTYLTSTTEGVVQRYYANKTQANLPNMDDLEGVTLGLLRIQEIYGVTAEEIASGFVKHINLGAKLTASDCFQIGYKIFELKYYYFSIGWFEMTLKRMEEEGWKGITHEIDELLIYDYLSYAQFSEGSLENAKAAVETVLKGLSKNYLSSDAIRLIDNLKAYIENYISMLIGEKAPVANQPPLGTFNRHDLTELNLLIKGCRGELKKPPEEVKNLFCYYETKNHPFLKIAPIKKEIMNLSPHLSIVYDVLYDSEIEILKELSQNNLVRAGVWNQEKGRGEASKVRTSKFAWFQNETHPLMHTLNQRVYDITGYSMETAEDFQLMNYGVGGHYDIHPDFFTEPDEAGTVKPYGLYEWGNRIATVLFYLSDVEHGGGTIWPHINVLALPKKGSAAFWHNLHADGKADDRSRHCACPIIAGSKWVLNKWIRIRSQEFRRPCLTYPDSVRL